MRKLILVLQASLLSATLAFSVQAETNYMGNEPNVLLVKIADLKQDENAANELRRHGAEQVRPLLRTTKMPVNSPLARWREVRFGHGVDLIKVIERLSKNPHFEKVEFNAYVKFDATPNDPKYIDQWALPKINAPGAWDVTTGNGNVVIGVIDTGVDITHPDLVANIWTNPGEIAGNGIDDDNNGYIDDVHGYDFGSNDADPTDKIGHGTHVAGTIAAVGNNAVGVTGVSWNSKLMVLKVPNDAGDATEANVINAIYYASVNGAFVTNNSYGFYIPGGVQPYGNQAIFDAIVDAYQHDSLFVAAAGNERGIYSWADRSGMTQTFPTFPLENIIVVSASDQYDNLASFSNFGSLAHLAAPGVDILSTVPKKLMHTYYSAMDGTSMATPHVTAVAALVRSVNPTLCFLDVKHRVLGTVDHVGDLASWKLITGGRLNANDAVRATPADTAMGWITLDNYVVAGTTQTLGVAIMPAAGGTLACDPKLNCGVGSYGKVRVWSVSGMVWDVFPFLQRVAYGYHDVDVAYNSSTGRYEASWNITSLVPQTLKVEYLGTSVNAQAWTAVQIGVSPAATVTTWMQTPPSPLAAGSSQTLKANVAPSDSGATPYINGNIRYYDNGTALGEVSASFPTITWNPTTVGTHIITAEYLGYTTTVSTGALVQVYQPSSAPPLTIQVY